MNGDLFQRSRETKSNVGGKQGSKDYWYWGTGNIRKQFSIVFFFVLFFFFFFFGGWGGVGGVGGVGDQAN